MEARLYKKRIVLPIGTAIGFKMIAKNLQKIDLNITESEDNSKFFALFDENDVDFEIEINNKECIHGIGYTLIVNNGFYDYYVGAGEFWSMEALYSRGRKLHFISEKTEKGQNVIKQTAEEFDLTYSESAAVCSRIEFNFEVEKVVTKPLPPQRLKGVKRGGDLDIRGLSALSSNFKCHSFSGGFSAPTLSSSGPQNLGSDIPDSMITEQSIDKSEDLSEKMSEDILDRCRDLDLSYNLAQSSTLSSTLSSTPLFGSQSRSSLAVKWNPKESEEKKKKNETQIGDKGVVCFGEQSNQLYNAYNGFTKDKDLEIKPFVVELRFSMKSE